MSKIKGLTVDLEDEGRSIPRGFDLDCEGIGQMAMVSASGTAVRLG